MIDDIKKTLWAAFTVLAILVLGGLPQQASAEITARCVLKKPLDGYQVGQTVTEEFNSNSPSTFHRWDEFCQLRPFSFDISGAIDTQLEESFRHLYNRLRRDTIFQSEKANYATIQFNLNSEGGNVENAIRIGRMLRDLNAWTVVNGIHKCSSSCVFLLVGGVDRNVWGRVGVHRPYFESLDRRRTAAQVSADIRALMQ